MDIEDAIQVAKLWRAGKMIGGDENEVRDALLTEVERLYKLKDWQDIATAPKDGTSVLLWFSDYGVMTGSYCSYDSANNAGGWAIGFDNYGPPPTYWMPSPKDPSP